MSYPDSNPFGVDARRLKDDAFRLAGLIRLQKYVKDTGKGPGSAEYDLGLTLMHLRDIQEDIDFIFEQIRILRENPELLEDSA
jgi:hypothetical protein